MKKHDVIAPKEFMELLANYGLKFDTLSGGRQISETASLSATGRHQYDISYPDGDSVMFFDCHFFLKTVELTEKSLKVKLFA